jgi:NAD(P)-dependent dehydrogenase (short-subunit alcohol dehydrogenase family)
MSKTWFITGAGRGIGFHIASAALQAGHKLAATGRNLSQLRDVFAGVPPDRIACIELDVTDAAQAHRAVQAAVDRFGRIDVLVNNAGYGLLGKFEEVSADACEHQFATNVFGLMHAMRAVLPVMRAQRSGHVFNLSSIGGMLGFDGASVYCASKFAVEGLSASIAQEVAKFNIHVSVIEPGFFRTDFLDEKSVKYGSRAIDDYAAEASAQSTYDAYNHRQPGDPARLGKVLVELADNANPPRQFLAGSDAVAMATQCLESRLEDIRTWSSLSRSTDGTF